MAEQKITITLKPDGNIDLNGPLHDKMLCYGMLHVAMNLIKDFKPSAIVAPTNIDIKRLEDDN